LPSRAQTAEQQFPQIQKAYAILSDEQQRAIYDAYGMKGIEAGSFCACALCSTAAAAAAAAAA
jgi:DnaJ-class molecular chaperone